MGVAGLAARRIISGSAEIAAIPLPTQRLITPEQSRWQEFGQIPGNPCGISNRYFATTFLSSSPACPARQSGLPRLFLPNPNDPSRRCRWSGSSTVVRPTQVDTRVAAFRHGLNETGYDGRSRCRPPATAAWVTHRRTRRGNEQCAPAVRCRNSLRRSFTALPLWSSQCPRFKLGPVPPSSFSHPIPHVLAEREVMR
jgi:hypothetical protein